MEDNQQQPGAEKTPNEIVLHGLNSAAIMAIPDTLVAITGKAQRASMALSAIKEIKDDETDLLANNLLVKVRKTFEEIQVMRAPASITLAQINGMLIAPEKTIDTDAKAQGSEYNRVKGLRNQYATAKEQKRQKDLADAEKTRKVQDEVTRVKAAIKQAIVDGVYSSINSMNNSIATYVSEMTLENWDERMKKFNVSPKLAEKVYQGYFAVQYNTGLIDQAVYAGIVADVQKEDTYEKINAIYVQQGEGIIKTWKDDMPTKKAALEDIKKLAETNKAQATLQLQALQEKEKEQAQARLGDAAAQQATATEAITTEKENEQLTNTFTAQVITQDQQEQKGIKKTRVAVIVGPDTNIVKTLGAVLFACYTNPKFKGHLARDAKGNLKGVDVNGNPIYAEWAATLLNFISKEYDGPAIEGIEFKEVISTIQKVQA